MTLSMTFSLKCYYGLWTGILAIINGLKLKHLTDGLVSYKQAVFHFTRCQLLFVDYCDDFIICLISYSDGTHSLQRIQWWMSDVVLNFSNRFQWKNKRIYILDGLSVSTFSELYIFFFLGGGGGGWIHLMSSTYFIWFLKLVLTVFLFLSPLLVLLPPR